MENAIEAISDSSGISIVLDPRIKEKAKTAVSARFRGDIAMQDAVRMLVESAELKVVHLASGLYVTTSEHADRMRNELAAIYALPLRVRERNSKATPGEWICEPDIFPYPLTPPLPRE